MFTAHPIRYLEDPKNLYGGSESINTIAREELKEDAPDAFALLNALSLTEDQLGKLELAIQETGDPVKSTRPGSRTTGTS